MSAFSTVNTVDAEGNGRTFWCALKTGEVFSFTAVKSISQIDPDLYPGDTYRDRADAAKFGCPQAQVMSGGEDSGFSRLLTEHPAAILAVSTDIPLKNPDVLQGNSGFAEDDEYTHTPPRPRMVTRSLLKFWDGLNGTGNFLGSIWLHEKRYLGPTKPIFLS